jgi:CHAT domain-containing protein
MLSAYDTAASAGERSTRSDEGAGLAYQFQRTKVDAVLATLWPVEDTATASLMKAFYGEVAKGTGYGAALSRAQRAELKLRPHPAFWAPFILMGSP